MTTLPELRPRAYRGKAYYDELKTIRAELAPALAVDVAAIKARAGKFVLRDFIGLALRYRLTCAGLASILEDERLIPVNSYDRMRRGGFKPVAALQEAWAALSDEERVSICVETGAGREGIL